MKKDTRFIPKLIAFIFLLVMAVIWVVPLAWGIVTSFKSEAEVASVGFKFLPVQWVTTNYTELLFDNAATPLLRWFMNSMIIALSQTVLVLIVVSLAAFAYSRLKFRGRNAMFVFFDGNDDVPKCGEFDSAV